MKLKHKTDSTNIRNVQIIVRRKQSYLILKRVVDYIGSVSGIILLSPLCIIIAIFIKLEDGGPVLFKQERVGHNGANFYIYKFRSMCQDAEKLKLDILEQNEVKGAMFKIKNDPRITYVGKFIRKHSLDELPQLVNVLLGDMSLVGPRPPLVEEVLQYNDYQKQRLLVRPGLSGLWQISGRNNLSFDQMVEIDLEYIQRRNMWLDLTIIFKTMYTVISIKKNGAC
ncbi:sugar transferase [Leuconostoc gasicomitatum]|uniref:sugar transferase n=1 Tax=Leuconostoc gasicomitatum TaxID=115778 RepID=UPI001CC827C3|nr:sugar transferase [Leuconostoc gasicomitatum]MBZ5981193.1 sugar transferase [Leuconostoc gasicomitatum]